MNALIALGTIAVVVLGTILFAVASVRRIRMSPHEYIIGGRGFGAVFLWVLLAGEIYTSFTFLGAAGWTYSFGAPAFYILAYGTFGYVLGYFLLPWIWSYAKERGLLTAPDFFAARYGSKTLATIVAVVQFAAVIPYVTLQLSAIEIFLKIAGYGTVNAEFGAVLSFIAIIAFVFATGLRGTAWASIVKDALVIGALLFVGVAIPLHFFGSPAVMFDQVLRAHPNHVVLGALTAPKGSIWFVTTVLLTGIGFFMGPHSIAAVYSAKDAGVLRRNAMFLPLYQLVLLLVFFAGFSALLIAPGLHGPAADQSFLTIVVRYYPAWIVGFVVATGTLCALVPSTALLLATASIVSKNIVSDLFDRAHDDRARLLVTRVMVVAIGLLALGLWIAYKTTLVSLLLLYYNGVTQFTPAFVFGALSRRTPAWGIIAGIVAGIAVALALALTNTAPFGCNPGFVGLIANVAIVGVATLLSKANEPAAIATGSTLDPVP